MSTTAGARKIVHPMPCLLSCGVTCGQGLPERALLVCGLTLGRQLFLLKRAQLGQELVVVVELRTKGKGTNHQTAAAHSRRDAHNTKRVLE